MRLGLIARADARGLGIQTKAFHDQMQPAKTMVVDCPSAQPLPIRRDWYPNAAWVKGIPSQLDWWEFLDGVDVVYTAETGYGSTLWAEAEQRGMRTVLHANYEFMDVRDRPTVWAAPSLWHIHDFPTGAVHLPVPVETHRFQPREPHPGPRHFLHIVGRPAIHDRNGTQDLLYALCHVTAEITVTIRCQDPHYLAQFEGWAAPRNVRINLVSGDVADYADMYDADVLVMPRRFGGLCLPVNEALGAGMPVVMPDIAPNNQWLPSEWLVPAHHAGSFRAKQPVELHTTNHRDLAAKIDELATDDAFYRLAVKKAHQLRAEMSWDALKPLYHEVLLGC